jgi:hypothetical protein
MVISRNIPLKHNSSCMFCVIHGNKLWKFKIAVVSPL